MVRWQRGLGGETPPFYAICSLEVGRHGHGITATWPPLPIRKHGTGSSEGLNVSPTGGRQHVREGMSQDGTTQGDDRSAKGLVVLHAATCGDRRIAQACNADQHGPCGVLRRPGASFWESSGAGAEGLSVMGGWWRHQDTTRVGKPGFRNIYPAKGHGLMADCTAKRVTCSAGHTNEAWHDQDSGGRIGERGKVCKTSTRTLGRADWEHSRVGSSVFEQGGNAPVRTVYRWSIYRAESGYQAQDRHHVGLGCFGEDHGLHGPRPWHDGLAPEVSAVLEA